MLKTLVGFILICFLFNAKGQDIRAILFETNGSGIVVRSGETHKLEIPFNFYINDIVKVLDGSITLLHIDGNEIAIKNGQTYSFKMKKESGETVIDENFKKTIHQFYVMRDLKIGGKQDINILPDGFNSSKSHEIYLEWKDMPLHYDAFILVMKEKTSDTLIYERFDRSRSYYFKKDFLPGRYRWIIDVKNDISMKSGEFYITKDPPICYDTDSYDAWYHIYVITCLINEKFWYEALLYAEKFIAEEGENSIYSYLKEKILIQMQQ